MSANLGSGDIESKLSQAMKDNRIVSIYYDEVSELYEGNTPFKTLTP